MSYPIRHAEAIQPPYLQACILDGLRKLPPLSQLRERFVPPEGDIIGGHRMGTQLDAVFGIDPEVFRLERWLIKQKGQSGAMQETFGLIFGHSSTICLGIAIAMMELSKMIFEVDFVIIDRSLLHADELRSVSKKL